MSDTSLLRALLRQLIRLVEHTPVVKRWVRRMNALYVQNPADGRPFVQKPGDALRVYLRFNLTNPSAADITVRAIRIEPEVQGHAVFRKPRTLSPAQT